MSRPATPESELRRAIAKLDAAIEVQQAQTDWLRIARAKTTRALEMLTGDASPVIDR